MYEGPLCPGLMEMQSSRASLSSVGNACCNPPPQMDYYVPAEEEGQETSDGNWNWGGRNALIQLRAVVTRAQMGYAHFHVHTPMQTPVLNGSVCTHANGRPASALRGIFVRDLLGVHRRAGVHTLACTHAIICDSRGRNGQNSVP